MTAFPKYDAYKKSKKESYYTRIKGFLKNAKRILKLANKPDRKEYFMVWKICAIGIALLGALSYVIQLIFSVAIPLGK